MRFPTIWGLVRMRLSESDTGLKTMSSLESIGGCNKKDPLR